MPNYLPPEIRAYYERNNESARLDTPEGQIEFLRTLEILRRYLPQPPATVCDIGGGTGRYACRLAADGYEVLLVDAAANLVDEAKAASAGQSDHPLASIHVGDARALEFSDAVADAVLLLGPLYHLTDFDDRLRALRECRRILKPGGVIFAAGISRYASALGSIFHKVLDNEAFAAIVDRDLVDGQHRNPTDYLMFFTTAYFHQPDELATEVADAGFEPIETLGIDGPGWLIPDLGNWSPKHRERLLNLTRALETESAVMGLSAHIMVVARK